MYVTRVDRGLVSRVRVECDGKWVLIAFGGPVELRLQNVGVRADGAAEVA